MKKEDIEKLSPEIKETEEWGFASHAYTSVCFSFPWPELTSGNESDREIEKIEELEQLIIDFPPFYAAYIDLGTKKLAYDYDEALELMDTGFDISMKINTYEIIEEEFFTFSENMENVFHAELTIRYGLKLLEKYPKEAFLYDQLCMAYINLGNFDLARKYGETAVELEPFNSHYLCNLGYNYMTADKLDEAIQYFELALKHDEDNKITKGNLKTCKEIKKAGLTFREYYLLPIDYDKVAELIRKGKNKKLSNYISDYNYFKLEIYMRGIFKNNCGKAHPYHDLVSSLMGFFNLADSFLDYSLIYEDVRWLRYKYGLIMEEYIENLPYRHDGLEIINTSILDFYNYLCENKVISESQLNELRDEIESLEDDLEEMWIENMEDIQ
jgi:tetratricopeptide (TPR) repeat protein